jgi:hypothetical protein
MPRGYVIFDDTVRDQNDSFAIELMRSQYSGNAKAVIKGIGVVTCVYVNPERDQFWMIDYRLYDPDGDGKSKLDHVREMLTNGVYQKQLPFAAVLMDTWYATKDLMLFMESLPQSYYCPLKDHRQVDDTAGAQPYRRVEALAGSSHERAHGKRIKIKGFPKDHKVRCFRVAVSTHRTDYVVTNDQTQDSTPATPEVCGSAGRLSSGTAKANRSPEWNAVSAARHASNAITLPALCSSGSDSRNWPCKRAAQSINSNTAC